jgi:hypothetical protein
MVTVTPEKNISIYKMWTARPKSTIRSTSIINRRREQGYIILDWSTGIFYPMKSLADTQESVFYLIQRRLQKYPQDWRFNLCIYYEPKMVEQNEITPYELKHRPLIHLRFGEYPYRLTWSSNDPILYRELLIASFNLTLLLEDIKVAARQCQKTIDMNRLKLWQFLRAMDGSIPTSVLKDKKSTIRDRIVGKIKANLAQRWADIEFKQEIKRKRSSTRSSKRSSTRSFTRSSTRSSKRSSMRSSKRSSIIAPKRSS